MSSKVEVIIEAKDSFSGTFKNFTRGLGPLTAAIGTVTGTLASYTSAILYNTKVIADNNDSVQKFSDRIKISTEALSKYEYIAERSGVQIAALRMGFQRMTRRIGEASMGTGIAVGALEDLDIAIKDIEGREPDKQFEILAQKLLAIEDPGRRAAMAMKFFDSEGVALLQTLTGGVEGLEQLKAEAEAFGIVVSEQAGKNAAAFNDSLTRLNMSVQGLRNYLAEKTMPVLTDLANLFANLVVNNRSQIIGFFEDVSIAMLKLAEYSAYAVGIMIDVWNGLRQTYLILKIVFLELAQTIQEGVDFITDKVVSMMERLNFRGIFDEAIAGARSFTSHNKEAIEVMEQMIQGAFDNLDVLSEEGLATARIAEFVEMAKEKFAELRESEDAPGLFQKSLGLTDEDIEKTTENAKVLADNVIGESFRAGEEHKHQVKYTKEVEAKGHKDRLKMLGDFSIKGFKIKQLLDLKSAIADTEEGAIAAYKAMAGIPIIGPALGAAAAAAVIAYGVARQAQISGLSLPIGQAHDGLSYVPREGTYLLSQGERVLAPQQNKDLTEALSGGVGGVLNVERLNLSVAENAINADSILAMDQEDWDQIVTEKIYPALQTLSFQGFKL